MLNNVMNNALSGINAAQGGLSVISNNLANAGGLLSPPERGIR